jgi:cyclomaltodextrinase
LLTLYPRENSYAMYLPLGSHDTERLMTVLGGSQAKVKLAFLFQFAYPGCPSIYYGDEIGLEGGKDPSCRKTFPWDPASWKTEIREFVQRLINLRRKMAVLRRGNFLNLVADDQRQCVAFARILGQEKMLVVVNASEARRTIQIPLKSVNLPNGHIFHNLLGQGEFIVNGELLSVTVPAFTGMWLV